MRSPVLSLRPLAAPPTFLLCFLASHAEAEFTIAQDGKASCAIVRSKGATEPEKYARKELAHFLGRVTGATITAAVESQASKETSRIYVGQTAFAAAHGIEFKKLGEEEWIIRTVGNHLILTGGRPRGTLYAVYEFLEDYVGCHWLDRRTEVIPSRASIRLGKIDVQSKPWFWQRAVHSPTGCPDDQWDFMIRNKNYRYDFRGRKDFYPKGAFYRLHGPKKSSVHSSSQFVNAKDWFETHPEYFALGRKGKRIPAYDGAGPGQLCLTHPDVERLTLEKLREFITADR
ncbi:MAG: alpha-glucuronidase family glycosyl hydrolase, partial [Planctomycetota bacterium]|nr:alpha-glucuronidase family glycosyl hydrolase [Planctomycetota bacterium]